MRDKLMYSIRKKERREKEDGATKMDFHSRSYHHYFEGYTEVTKTGADGRTRLERVYTGLYHIQDLSCSKKILLRITYVLFLLLAAVLFFAGAVQNVGSNRAWYVAAAESVSVGGIFWMGCTMVNYLTAPRKLTLHEYRSTSVSVRRASMTAALGLAAASFLTVFHVLMHLGTFELREIWCAVFMLLSAGFCIAVYLVERRISYTKEYSDEIIPQGGIEID